MDAKEHHKFYADWNPSSFLLGSNSYDDPCDPSNKEKVQLEVICPVTDVKEVVKDLPQLKDLPALLTRPKRDHQQQQQQQLMTEIDEDCELNTSLDAQDPQEDQPQDSQNLLRLLEDHEKIGHLFKCARVQGLETIDGLLLFGK